MTVKNTNKRNLKKTKKQRGGGNNRPPPVPERNNKYNAMKNDISEKDIENIHVYVNQQKSYNTKYKSNKIRNNNTILKEFLQPGSIFTTTKDRKTIRHMIKHSIKSTYTPSPTDKPRIIVDDKEFGDALLKAGMPYEDIYTYITTYSGIVPQNSLQMYIKQIMKEYKMKDHN